MGVGVLFFLIEPCCLESNMTHTIKGRKPHGDTFPRLHTKQVYRVTTENVLTAINPCFSGFKTNSMCPANWSFLEDVLLSSIPS